MHNREMIYIVKIDSFPKTQLTVNTNYSFCCHLRETYAKTNQINNVL